MPRVPMALLVLGLAAFVVLTSCTAAVGPTATVQGPSPTASPTPEPTSSPTPDLQAIGEAYLAAVKPANAAGCSFGAVVGVPTATLDELKRATADLAKSLRVWADALRVIDWPAEMESDAQDLIKAVATEETVAIQLSVAPSLAAYNADYQSTFSPANVAGSAAANQIRGDLGLPSVAGDPCAT